MVPLVGLFAIVLCQEVMVYKIRPSQLRFQSEPPRRYPEAAQPRDEVAPNCGASFWTSKVDPMVPSMGL